MQQNSEAYRAEMPKERLAHEQTQEEGIGLWGAMKGQRSSSTRMEIAGLVNAMTRAAPLHIALDSASTIAKAKRLQQEAAVRCLPSTAQWWNMKNPYHKPWGLQADGDLWKLYWHGLMERGPMSITITKVKGHATMKQVLNDEVKARDKDGNDWADTYATRGIQQHGTSAVSLAKYFGQRQASYEKLMEEVQMTIIAVIKAEKAERETRQKVESAAKGFDEQKVVITTGIIPHNPQDELEAKTLTLTPPTKGPHKHRKQQALYVSIHNFIVQNKWKCMRQEAERAGSTWLELFVAFDQGGFRCDGAQHRLDQEAAKRTEVRRKKAAKMTGGRRKVNSDHQASSDRRIALRAELANFKSVFRYIVRNQMCAEEAKWFAASNKWADRRLSCIGVYGNQPAIHALLITTPENNVRTSKAIALHRAGPSINDIINAAADNRYQEGVKLRWARLETGAPARWKRLVSTETELGIDASSTVVERPLYTERLLHCHVCGTARETMHMQLRMTSGYRSIQCLMCRKSHCSGRMMCTCGVWWHLCDSHRIDPVEHKRMKRPAHSASLALDVLLPSNRPAPDTVEINSRALKRRRIELYPRRTAVLSAKWCPALAARFPHLAESRT